MESFKDNFRKWEIRLKTNPDYYPNPNLPYVTIKYTGNKEQMKNQIKEKIASKLYTSGQFIEIL